MAGSEQYAVMHKITSAVDRLCEIMATIISQIWPMVLVIGSVYLMYRINPSTIGPVLYMMFVIVPYASLILISHHVVLSIVAGLVLAALTRGAFILNRKCPKEGRAGV
jgi:hypothetical protein